MVSFFDEPLHHTVPRNYLNNFGKVAGKRLTKLHSYNKLTGLRYFSALSSLVSAEHGFNTSRTLLGNPSALEGWYIKYETKLAPLFKEPDLARFDRRLFVLALVLQHYRSRYMREAMYRIASEEVAVRPYVKLYGDDRHVHLWGSANFMERHVDMLMQRPIKILKSEFPFITSNRPIVFQPDPPAFLLSIGLIFPLNRWHALQFGAPCKHYRAMIHQPDHREDAEHVCDEAALIASGHRDSERTIGEGRVRTINRAIFRAAEEVYSHPDDRNIIDELNDSRLPQRWDFSRPLSADDSLVAIDVPCFA